MNKIGIIGGMGPMATVDFYNKIISQTPASCDQEHIPAIIDIVPQIPDRTAYLLGSGESPLTHLLESTSRLACNGVDAICMPCNTAHAFIGSLRHSTSVLFISIIESTLESIQAEFPGARRIALLATSGTHISKIYHHAFTQAGLEVMSFSDSFQERIMNIIYTVKQGRKEDVIADYQSCISILSDQGAEVIVAGCTELPLLTPHVKSTNAIVDPTMALAKSVVRFALSGLQE